MPAFSGVFVVSPTGRGGQYLSAFTKLRTSEKWIRNRSEFQVTATMPSTHFDFTRLQQEGRSDMAGFEL